MKQLTIFLASSAELAKDRQEFELMIARINHDWRPRDIAFEIVVWENFIDALSRDGLQSEYNRAIEKCDIFVMLFFKKVGRYTLEEFETAFKDLQTGNGPHIYTYFRNDYVRTGELDDDIKGLLDFKARLASLKHYPTLYSSTEDLLWQFSRQLEKLYPPNDAAAAEITDGTPQSKIDEVALLLSYRQLFGESALDEHDSTRLPVAVQRTTAEVREAIYLLAQMDRINNWAGDKYRMERCIPVFVALKDASPDLHAPLGQLGFALRDKKVPDYTAALKCFERALELRGDRVQEGMDYQAARALCRIHLDPSFKAGVASDAETRREVMHIIDLAQTELGDNWGMLLQLNPYYADIKRWISRNGA